MLRYNEILREVPNGFLVNLISLRVLIFHRTAIRSLPTSLWKLRGLEFLSLGFTEIEDISEEIGNLSRLQFLYLNGCKNVKSLPCRMGELKNQKYLNLWGCNLNVIPDEIRKLPHCEIVFK